MGSARGDWRRQPFRGNRRGRNRRRGRQQGQGGSRRYGRERRRRRRTSVSDDIVHRSRERDARVAAAVHVYRQPGQTAHSRQMVNTNNIIVYRMIAVVFSSMFTRAFMPFAQVPRRRRIAADRRRRITESRTIGVHVRSRDTGYRGRYDGGRRRRKCEISYERR